MAVKQTSQKILAVVETISKPKPSQYGSGTYQSVLFLRYDREGDEAKVWVSMGETNAKLFRKGMQVYLAPVTRDGKQSWDVEVIDAATPLSGEQTATPKSELTVTQKREIAQYIDSRTDLLGYCFEVVNRKLTALDTDSQRAAAIELYRSTAHKFDL